MDKTGLQEYRGTYKVKEIREIKCWTIFELETGASLLVRRSKTNRDLVDIITGEEIEVGATRLPPIQGRDIRYISYRGQQLYPI